ncbi:ATP-binding protein [Sphingobacterium spiritivorum]|uniref:PAS domain-containing sensor histidine kinase n=1 Tax=Sphingobacterium spiritivorum TaxID=258 RepID=UPI003DA213BD
MANLSVCFNTDAYLITTMIDNTFSLTNRQLLDILILSKDATAIYSSEDLIIEFANDSMLTFWGKDRSIIGMELGEVVAGLKEQGFIDLLKNVWNSGNTYEAKDVPAKLFRDGHFQTYYFDFIYRALLDETGRTYAILHTATEVSERIAAWKLVQSHEKIQQQINKELKNVNNEFKQANKELKQANKELTTLSREHRAINIELSQSNEYSRNVNEKLIEINSELLLSQRQFEHSEMMLRLAIEAANFGTWSVNVETRELVASVRLKELFGFYPEQQVSLNDCLDQVTEEYRDWVTESIETAIAEGNGYDLSYTVKGFHDQKIRWLRAVGRMIGDVSSEGLFFTGVVMDISKQKSEEQLKNDFISIVSHELKTPLTSLMGYVQILQLILKDHEDERLTGILDRSKSQVSKMNSMISGFLNVSRFEDGNLYLEKQSFEINDMISEIISDVSLTHSAHRIEFEPTQSVVLYADRDKLGQVVNNLLSNAIKYAPQSKDIFVKCALNSGNLLVSVKDRGLGIQQEELERLFTRFYRIENKQTKTISGFGIGLYLCAEIIKRHNGRIWAESEEGKGSVFHFTIPVARPE